jgi:hypothetical protein
MVVDANTPEIASFAQLVNARPSNVEALCSEHHRHQVSFASDDITHLLEQVPGLSQLGLLTPRQGLYKRELVNGCFHHNRNLAGISDAVNTKNGEAFRGLEIFGLDGPESARRHLVELATSLTQAGELNGVS